MLEKDLLVLKIMHLAYLVHTQTSYCVFIDFSGHVERLEIKIRESKERWQNEQCNAVISLQYRKHRDNGNSPTIAELKAKADVLETILAEHEIPFDDMDYEEEYTRYYSF